MLTEVGIQLLDYAERLLNLAEEAQNVVQPTGPPRGVLTVSASESVLAYRLPKLLRVFQARYPGVQLRLLPDSGTSMNGSSVDQSADIAFMIDEMLDSEHRKSRILCEEEVVILVAPEHGLAKCRQFSWGALAGQQLLLTDRSCSYRVLLERSLRAANIQLGGILELASVEAIKHCAMAAIGVAVLPRMAVTKEMKQRRLVALHWPGLRPRMCTRMVRSGRRWLSPAASALWTVSERHFRLGAAPQA